MKITESDIREQVSPESYRRGEPYWSRGAVRTRRQSTRSLRAQCEGSRAEPYRVTIECASDSITSAYCTCPVGAQGQCKHVAATLLAWLHEPDSFTVLEEVDEALKNRSRQELEAMVRYMMRRVPELEMTLLMKFPTSEPRQGAIDMDVYQIQVDAVFRENAGGMGAASQIADELAPILDLARDFDAQEDYAAAVRIYGALLSSMLVHMEDVRDEEGFLTRVLDMCLEHSVACLAREHLMHQTRHDILSMLATLAMEETSNVARTRAESLMLKVSSSCDRKELALHIRQLQSQRQQLTQVAHEDSVPSQNRLVDTWLLLQLEAPDLDEDVFMARCRALGKKDALVAKLLELERIDEAIDFVAHAESEHFMALVHEFSRLGFSEHIEPIVQERYAQTAGLDLLSWLQQRHAERGEVELARSTATAIFYRKPSLQVYEDIKALCVSTNHWQMTRPSLLAHMRERSEWSMLVRVHIRDGMIETALEILESSQTSNQMMRDTADALLLELADAARKSRPRTAVRLYQRLAEGRIEKRSAASFKEAAQIHERAYVVASELGDAVAWRAYLEELHARYGRFQGLVEAMSTVGLVFGS